MTFDAFVEYVARPILEPLAAKSVWRSWCYRIDRRFVEIDIAERTPRGVYAYRIQVTEEMLLWFSGNYEFLAERINETTRILDWE